jgi:hypothetical protein
MHEGGLDLPSACFANGITCDCEEFKLDNLSYIEQLAKEKKLI